MGVSARERANLGERLEDRRPVALVSACFNARGQVPPDLGFL
jgi:hypothetical protein